MCNLVEIESDCAVRIHMVQDEGQMWTLMNLLFQQKARNFLSVRQLLVSQDGFGSNELILTDVNLGKTRSSCACVIFPNDKCLY
jgi:hypothetical protein